MNHYLHAYEPPSPEIEQSILEANNLLAAQHSSLQSEIADYQATADFETEKVCQ